MDGTGDTLVIGKWFETARCRLTVEGGVFMTTMGREKANCVASLSEHYDALAESEGRSSIIKHVAAGLCGVLLLTCCGLTVAKHPKRAKPAKVIGKTEIEQHFPVTTASSTPTCTICLVPIQEEEQCRTLQCTHPF